MAKYQFSAAERLAVWSVNYEKCYSCSTLLDLDTMHVDHIIPESLLSSPERLMEVLKDLGRSPKFDVNSFENWVPACPPCNVSKGEMVFDPSPLVQRLLQTTAARASKAAKIANEKVTDIGLSKSINRLMRKLEEKNDSESLLKAFQPLLEKINALREPELVGTPLRVTSQFEVMRIENGMMYLSGPTGMWGVRPVGDNLHPSWNCPRCKTDAFWNGSRCVGCGLMDDGD